MNAFFSIDKKSKQIDVLEMNVKHLPSCLLFAEWCDHRKKKQLILAVHSLCCEQNNDIA